MYIQQLNYWRGPIDACTLYQNIGGVAPMIDAHGYRYKLVFSRPYLVRSRYWYAVASVVIVCNVMYCG